jgi:hypothetical protein
MCQKVIVNGMNDSSLTKEKILQLIKNHDASLTFVKPKKSSSSVWSSFSYVYVNNRKKDFVSCDKCKDVLHHKSIDGTSNMTKHLNSSESGNKNITNVSISIKEYLRPKTSQTIPRMLKDKIISRDQRFPTQFLGSEVGTIYFRLC